MTNKGVRVGKKPRKKEDLDKLKDKRLWNAYGISLNDYNYLLDKNGGLCWICGKPPVTRGLSVEHDHSYTKVKIQTHRPLKKGYTWRAEADYNGQHFCYDSLKRADAVRFVRDDLKRASVRGVACWFCNKGLHFYGDRPDLLRAAADYLENFKKKKSPLTGRENV